MNLTVDREDVQAFLATLPADPERDRRADVLRAAARTFTDALGRKRELSARLEQIAHELVDATGKERDQLIAERGAVASELGTTSVTIKVVTGRFADALVAWCTYTYRQVVAAHDEASGQIRATSEQRRHLVHRLTELESSTQYADQAIPVRAEYDAVCAGMRPHYQRQDQAGNVAQAIECDLRSRFGDEARGGGVETRFIDRYVAGVGKAVA